jgi:hypothetical protein
MSRGDEACFVCEFKNVRGNINRQQIRAMEDIVRAGDSGGQWRYAYRAWEYGFIRETPTSGAFVNGMKAARALVCHTQGSSDEHSTDDDQNKESDDESYIGDATDGPSVEDRMEFAMNRAPTRTAAVTCMQRLSSSVLGTRTRDDSQ